MKFRTLLSDPYQQDITELGELNAYDLVAAFEKIDWSAFIDKAKKDDVDNLEFSLNLEFTNLENNQELSVSVMVDSLNTEFSVIYIRPKAIKKFFGLINSVDENYLTCSLNFNKAKVIECINAFSKNNFDFLEENIF